MYKLFLVIATFLGYCNSVAAQQSVVDSLLKLLPSAKEDTSKVLLYIDIGNRLENNDPVKARSFYHKAAVLSSVLKYDAGIIKSYTHNSSTFMVEGNLDSMLYFNELALDLSRKIKDSLNIGIALFNIGTVYRERYDFEKAIELCLEGRAIMEAKGHIGIEVQMNDALMLLYNSRSEYNKAIQFGEKAVALAKQQKMEAFLAQVLINLSMPYSGKKEYSKASVLIRQAMEIAKKLGDKRIEAVGLQNLAGVLLAKGDYLQMEQYLLKSLPLYKEIGSIDGEASIFRALGVSYLQQKKYEKAKEYAQKSLAISKANNYKMDIVTSLRLLSSIFYATGDVEKGIDYDEESNDILEEMVKSVLSEQSANLEKKYETQKKESMIKQLEADKKIQQLSIRQKSTLNYILVAAAAVILLVSLLSYRNYRQKQKIQQQRINELETEKQLAATEAVLKGEEQERTRLAKDLHDGLGGMLSGIKYSLNTMKGNLIMTPDNALAFERSMEMLDSSIREMRRVAHNMMPEALVKFGLDTALKDFCNDINQSGALRINYQSFNLEGVAIEQITAITVYRMVQELVNNSIKHANANQAIVQLSLSGNMLQVTVEDDGKGFDTIHTNLAEGMGWKNIRSRIDFLKGKVDVHSEIDKGTSVNIELRVTG